MINQQRSLETDLRLALQEFADWSGGWLPDEVEEDLVRTFCIVREVEPELTVLLWDLHYDQAEPSVKGIADSVRIPG
jgi:hypothetical protein